MKKTYKTPTMLAVILLQENMLAELSYGGEGGGMGADVKEHTDDLGSTTGSKSIWDEEW